MPGRRWTPARSRNGAARCTMAFHSAQQTGAWETSSTASRPAILSSRYPVVIQSLSMSPHGCQTEAVHESSRDNVVLTMDRSGVVRNSRFTRQQQDLLPPSGSVRPPHGASLLSIKWLPFAAANRLFWNVTSRQNDDISRRFRQFVMRYGVAGNFFASFSEKSV